MIFYFSGTGNTKFVATELAKLLGDEAVNVTGLLQKGNYGPFNSEKPFILCAPTYVCEAPRFFNDFVRKATFTGCKDVYYISTSGGYSGISGNVIGSIIRRKKLNYKGCAEFVLAQNYIANKKHTRPSDEVIKQRILDTKEKIISVAETIKAGGKLKSRHVWLLELLIDFPSNPVMSYIGHKIKGFTVDSRCIACGKCEKNCPVSAIKMQDGKPVWHGSTCAHCMACIQNCPVESINFRDRTQNRKRYRFDDFRYVLKESE